VDGPASGVEDGSVLEGGTLCVRCGHRHSVHVYSHQRSNSIDYLDVAGQPGHRSCSRQQQLGLQEVI